MKIISHRGNLSGPCPKLENSIEYISKAYQLGYDVEVDVWHVNNGFYLGHDKPDHLIDEEILEDPKFWCHAKNLGALNKMLKNCKINCFWHQKDNFTLTSSGFIWTFPHNKVCDQSIIVDLRPKEVWLKNNYNCYGICADFII